MARLYSLLEFILRKQISMAGLKSFDIVYDVEVAGPCKLEDKYG